MFKYKIGDLVKYIKPNVLPSMEGKIIRTDYVEEDTDVEPAENYYIYEVAWEIYPIVTVWEYEKDIQLVNNCRVINEIGYRNI